MTDDVAAAKEQAEALVRTARSLVAKAEEEAASIILAGRERVEAMLADIESLRRSAESDAARARAEAEQERADARRASDQRRAEASTGGNAAAGQTWERAETMAAEEVATDAPASDGAVRGASEVADRILRVARSEAEARSRELVEHARRKADQIEHDARSRTDLANHEHRELVRLMQQRELDAKARLRSLESEIAGLERRLGRLHDEERRRGMAPTDSPEIAASSPSGIVFPAPATRPEPRPEPPAPDTARRPVERRGPQTAPGQDPDMEKAMRAIRRRA